MLVSNNENACCRSQISLYYDHVDIRYHFYHGHVDIRYHDFMILCVLGFC